jgi:hypothetical protein
MLNNESFEDEIYNVMEKYNSNNKLTQYDIKCCREICVQFENLIIAQNLTNKIKSYCQKYNYDINFDDEKEKISVLFYESINVDKKDKVVRMNVKLFE